MFRVFMHLYFELPLYLFCSIWLNVNTESIDLYTTLEFILIFLSANASELVLLAEIHVSILPSPCLTHDVVALDCELFLSFFIYFSHSDANLSRFHLSKESGSRTWQTFFCSWMLPLVWTLCSTLCIYINLSFWTFGSFGWIAFTFWGKCQYPMCVHCKLWCAADSMG